jgi:hypothetical protein
METSGPSVIEEAGELVRIVNHCEDSRHSEPKSIRAEGENEENHSNMSNATFVSRILTTGLSASQRITAAIKNSCAHYTSCG